MDNLIGKDRIHYLDEVYTNSFTREFSVESIVKDAQPDIGEILATDTSVLLRNKEAEDGRVSVGGVIRAVVLYTPEAAFGIRKIEMEIPFSVAEDDPAISHDSRVMALVSVFSSDAKTVNPRKIVFRAELCFAVNCFDMREAQISPSLESGAAPEVEILTESKTASMTTDVCEKTFVVSENFSLPDLTPEDILSMYASVTCNETSIVGSRLLIKGTAVLRVLYADTQEQGSIQKAEYSTAFSQVVDMETAGDKTSCDVSIMVTGAYFNHEDTLSAASTVIMMELHAVCQCTARQSFEINYISDVYSPKYACSAENEKTTLSDYCGETKITETLRETVKTASPPKKVVRCEICLSPVTLTAMKDTIELKTMANVTVIYVTENGRTLCASRKYPVTSNMKPEAGKKYVASASVGGDVLASPVTEGVDVRAPIVFTVMTYKLCEINAVKNVNVDKSAARDMSKIPSLYIHRVTEGDSLWALAKKYYSTRDLIAKTNDIELTDQPEPSAILIIPKKR
ncbi:MAG: SPOCS domain-containing protein [Oscillospiraceae bacterium]